MSPLMRTLVVPVLCAVGLVSVLSAQDVSRADADRMSMKVIAIEQRAALAPAQAPPLRTTFTEGELNAYLVHHGAEQLPAGIRNVRVTMHEGSKLEARAVVDLDAVRTSQPRGWRDPLGYIAGALEVVTVGTLSGSAGQGVYRFESGSIGGIPIPRAVMQEVVAFYSKSEELPQGISLDEPFTLPAGIREVEVRKGAATVIQ